MFAGVTPPVMFDERVEVLRVAGTRCRSAAPRSSRRRTASRPSAGRRCRARRGCSVCAGRRLERDRRADERGGATSRSSFETNAPFAPELRRASRAARAPVRRHDHLRGSGSTAVTPIRLPKAAPAPGAHAGDDRRRPGRLRSAVSEAIEIGEKSFSDGERVVGAEERRSPRPRSATSGRRRAPTTSVTSASPIISADAVDAVRVGCASSCRARACRRRRRSSSRASRARARAAARASARASRRRGRGAAAPMPIASRRCVVDRDADEEADEHQRDRAARS